MTKAAATLILVVCFPLSAAQSQSSTGRAPAIKRVTDGKHYILVSDIRSSPNPPGPGMEKVTFPGHFFVSFRYESDDPELQPDKRACGELRSADGKEIELGGGVGYGKFTPTDSTKKTLSICMDTVPNGTKGIYLHFANYPRVALGM